MASMLSVSLTKVKFVIIYLISMYSMVAWMRINSRLLLRPLWQPTPHYSLVSN